MRWRGHCKNTARLVAIFPVIRSWGLQESEGSNMGLTILFHKYLF